MTTIAIAILVLLAAIMLLMIISLILWQKRSSEQLSILQNVETHLNEIELSLEAAEKRAKEFRKQEEPCITEEPQVQEIPEIPLENIDLTTEIEQDNLIIEEPKAAEEKEEPILESMIGQAPESEETSRGSETPASSIYNIGKSGKIYTEEELELLIKE